MGYLNLKNFVIETTHKMPDFLVSALTVELGSTLRGTFFKIYTYFATI